MSAARSWFDVDKAGLAKVVRKNGCAFIVNELVQNALDTGARRIDVSFEPVDGQAKVWVRIADDDPDGFRDLAHAYTLFAESERKADPTKRGRFNLGEKLVLAACEEASITSTKGAVRFDSDGRRAGRTKREQGTEFLGLVRMTRAELEEVRSAARLVIAGAGVTLTVDGSVVPTREPLRGFEATLPTVVADEEGCLKRATRRTVVNVYAPISPDVRRLFEMGIPVVEVDLPWDVEVMQKVPLNADRDNVSPAYARELAVAVVNEMHAYLKPEEATAPGVQEALAHPDVMVEAVQTILTHQHGELRTTADPRDPESIARAQHRGYAVIQGGSYSKPQWENIRKAEAAKPSSFYFPSPKVYSDDPGATPTERIPESEWTPGMRALADYATELAWRTIHKAIEVRYENRFGAIDGANYGSARLVFNVGTLGRAWFDQGQTEQLDGLLIHELAHEHGHHLTKEFDDGLRKIGARMKRIALEEPEFFRKHAWGKGG